MVSKKALINVNHSIWIEASAGTGKTSLLVERISELILQGVAPERILCITFTKNAASEIMDRVSQACSLAQVRCSTIHSFAKSILDQHIHKVDVGIYEGFSILEEGSQGFIIQQVKDVLALEHPEVLDLININDYSIDKSLKDIINLAVNSDALGDIDSLAKAVQRVYISTMRKWNIVSYSDLVSYANKLMQYDEIASIIDAQIDHIMVDEAQDTNTAQWALIHKIVSNFSDHNKTCFVVGDPKQSIYSFQGVVSNYFKVSKGVLKKAIITNGGEWRDYSIPYSYRSPKSVIELLNRMFNTTEGWDTQATVNSKSGSIKIWPRFQNSKALVEGVVDVIKNYKSEGKEMSEILVLFQNRGSAYKAICNHLTHAKIDYVTDEKIPIESSLIYMDLINIGMLACNPESKFYRAAVMLGPLVRADLNQITYPNAVIENILEIDTANAYEFYSEILSCYWDKLTCNNYRNIRIASAFISGIDRTQTIRQLIQDGFNITYRDNINNRQSLKILTVHGAKGLQAPFVILPQCINSKSNLDSKGNLNEYFRLMYVAITRTMQDIHIMGSGIKDDPRSWYSRITKAYNGLRGKN